MPDLKEWSDLSESDFAEHPVWVNVRTFDYDEDWYDDVDETVFRPWTGEVPIDPTDAIFLVSAYSTLPGGQVVPGFLSPSESDDLGELQPCVFVGGRMFEFWQGSMDDPPISIDECNRFAEAVGGSPEVVFPLTVAAGSGLGRGSTTAVIHYPG